MSLLAHHGQNSVFAEPLIIRNILLDPEGRDNIVGCRADVVGGVEPYTYLWTELSGDDTFITGTGGALPAGSTEGDSITSTEEIGWHSSINTTATSPYDVRCQITDAVGTVVSVDFQVVDDAPNYVTFAKSSTVEYDEEVVYTIVLDADYSYAWVLPEYARLTAGTVSDNEITIVWDDAVSLEDRDVDLVCTVTSISGTSPQPIYAIVTETVTVQANILTGSASTHEEWSLDNDYRLTEAAGAVSQVGGRNGNDNLTAPSGQEPTWDGSKISFDGINDVLEAAPTLSNTTQTTLVWVGNIDDNAANNTIMSLVKNATVAPYVYMFDNSLEQLRFSAAATGGAPSFNLSNGVQSTALRAAIGRLDSVNDTHRLLDSTGTEQTSTLDFSTEVFDFDELSVGAFDTGAGFSDYFLGDMYFVAIISGELSDTEMDNILTRLETHYGL